MQLSPDDDEIDLERVGELVSADPAFAAEMLRAANSPLFGVRSQVYGIRHAVTILGLERTKALAFRIAMEEYLGPLLSEAAVRRSWLHTLACAEIAKELAGYCGIAKDAAYTAGLMHDMGRLALLRGYSSEYVPLLCSCFDSPDQVLEAENEKFGYNHCEAGRALAGIWGFPKELSEIAYRHHAKSPRPAPDTLHIVRLACAMADITRFDAVRCNQNPSYNEIQASFPPGLRGRYNPSLGQLEERVTDRILSIEK